MAAVDRADYMDNIKVAEIEQTIQKERAEAIAAACRTQRAFLDDQVKKGNIVLKPPTPRKAQEPLSKRFGVPDHLNVIRNDPETSMQLELSRSLWGSCNPGYHVRDGSRITSTMKEHYLWDEEEIDFMKQQRLLDKTHNRRRDEHTHYVECRALYNAMMKGP